MWKKGDKVRYGPVRGTVRRVGRRETTKDTVWIWVTEFSNGPRQPWGKVDKPFERIVDAKYLHPWDAE